MFDEIQFSQIVNKWVQLKLIMEKLMTTKINSTDGITIHLTVNQYGNGNFTINNAEKTSRVDQVEQLSEIRNKIVQHEDPKLTQSAIFDSIWLEIPEILLRLLFLFLEIYSRIGN